MFADEITLHMPELDLKPDVDVLCSDPETVEKLEQCAMNWQTHITIVIEEQQHKKPQVCDSLYIPRFNQGKYGGITAEDPQLKLDDLWLWL